MKKILILLTVPYFAGCAVSDYLKPHEGVSNAQIRFVSIPSNNNFIQEPKRTDCISEAMGMEIAVLGKKANLIRKLSRTGIPLYDSSIADSQQNEVYIPAEKEFHFQFNGVGIAGILPGAVRYSYCRKLVSFTPEADGLYEAKYGIVETSDGKETCDVKLFEITKDVGGNYIKNEMKDYKVIHDYCNK